MPKDGRKDRHDEANSCFLQFCEFTYKLERERERERERVWELLECQVLCDCDVYHASHSLLVRVPAGLVLRGFALTRLENLHHLSNLRKKFRFDGIWIRRYAIIFGLT
jgi:hypothetical protein